MTKVEGKSSLQCPVPDGKAVPALFRGVRIVDAVIAADHAPTVSELSRWLMLPKSTVHGLCSTLVELGLLVRHGGATFVVGPHVMRWANAFLAQTDLANEFTALCDRGEVLADETFTLSVLDGREVMYVACRNSSAPLGVTFRIGMRLPVEFPATGKAILSTMTEQEVRDLLSDGWSKPLTRFSVTNIDDLLGELEETRRRGFSIDDGQIREGMHCYGVPIRDSSNRVVAGLAVSLRAMLANERDVKRVTGILRHLAHRLSERLGADPSMGD